MSRLIILGVVLAGLSMSALAVDTPGVERRESMAVYTVDESTQPTAGQAVPATPAAGRETAPAPTGPLADLRARQLAEYEAMGQAMANARDAVEYESLSRQAVEMKSRHTREELEWLKADALRHGDMAYAGRLDEALSDLMPRPVPAAVVVSRDPATGRALGGERGGAK